MTMTSKASARRERIKERLGGQLSVPTLPRRVARIRDLLADPDVSLREVGDEIALDPPLSACLLRTVNSAGYGLQTTVLSPRHAASVAGMRGMRNLMLRAPVLRPPIPLGTNGFDVRDLWRQGILTARLCVEAYDRIPAARADTEEDLYAHGLLHDVGQFAMFDGLGEDWAAVYRRATQERLPIEELELEAFGFAHHELGAMLLKRWSLGEEIVRTARFHHNEAGLAELEPRVGVLLLCSTVAELARTNHLEELHERVPSGTAKLLGLGREALEGFAKRATELLSSISI